MVKIAPDVGHPMNTSLPPAAGVLPSAAAESPLTGPVSETALARSVGVRPTGYRGPGCRRRAQSVPSWAGIRDYSFPRETVSDLPTDGVRASVRPRTAVRRTASGVGVRLPRSCARARALARARAEEADAACPVGLQEGPVPRVGRLV